MSEREFFIAYRQTLIDGDLAERCQLLADAGLVCFECGDWLGRGFVGHPANCTHCASIEPGAVRPQRSGVPTGIPNAASTSV